MAPERLYARLGAASSANSVICRRDCIDRNANTSIMIVWEGRKFLILRTAEAMQSASISLKKNTDDGAGKADEGGVQGMTVVLNRCEPVWSQGWGSAEKPYGLRMQEAETHIKTRASLFHGYAALAAGRINASRR